MSAKKHSNLSALALPAAVLVFNTLLILFPRETIHAAREGLLLWFNNVLPSLLPFLIGTNLLMGLGVVHSMGVLLEPLMRSLFGIGGNGGFALAVGLLSGYPVGAKVTAMLRADNAIPQDEAQRLAALASNAGPLFIMGTVGSAMFGSVAAGGLLMLAHYGGWLLTGLLCQWPSGKKREKNITLHAKPSFRNLLRRTADAGRTAPPLGILLRQSVADAVETLLHVGGYIVLFSVLVTALELLGLPGLLARLAQPFTRAVGWTDNALPSLLTGIFEMTNGTRMASAFGATREGLVLAAAALAWGGLSVHAQAIGFLSRTDIAALPYILTKLVHALFSAVLGYILYPFFAAGLAESVPAMSVVRPAEAFLYAAGLLALSVLVPLACAALWCAGRWLWQQKLFAKKGFPKRIAYDIMKRVRR